MKTARLVCAVAMLQCGLAAVPVKAQLASAVTAQGPSSVTSVRFHFHADGAVRGGFALAHDRLLFGTEAGTFYAVSQQDGHLLWKVPIGSPALSTPVIRGNVAYLTAWDNSIHCVDIRNGRQVWHRTLGRTLGSSDYWEYYVSSPLLVGNRLYVGSGDGQLYAIEPSSGQIVWAADLKARIRTTPTASGKTIVVGTMLGEVVAVRASDGKREWSFATRGAAHDFSLKNNDTRSVVTSPLVVGKIVIAGGRDGYVYGIDADSGRERWHETHDGASWILGLAHDDRAVYVGSGSAYVLQAADLSSGKELWRVPTGNAMFGGVAKAGDVLVSNGITGTLFGFGASKGTQLWRFELPDITFASPLVADGLVVTGADDGSVIALNTSSAAAQPLRRFVYSYTNEQPAGFFWFKRHILGYINEAFTGAGYQKVGSDELPPLLAHGRTAESRNVILLADTRLPDGVDGKELRRFLDDGGVLILIGPNPVDFDFGKDGAPSGEDPQRAEQAFGIAPPDKQRDYGFNVSRFSPAAQALGLAGTFETVGWARPDQVSAVLASDRSGMATAWLKHYSNGGMLIDLPQSRTRAGDVSSLINAIDLAVTNSEAGKF